MKASENVESSIYQYLYTHTGSLSMAEISHFTFWQILSKVSKIPKLYIPSTINTKKELLRKAIWADLVSGRLYWTKSNPQTLRIITI